MKYAITGPRGRIIRVLDEPNDQTIEISDAQADLVSAAKPPDGYFLVEGQFISRAEEREIRRAARRAERLANRTPEQVAADEQREQIQAAYDAAYAAFESLPKGKQALWEPVRVKVAAAILAGNMAEALEIITTVPVIYDGAEDDRAVFRSLFTPEKRP